MHKSVNVQDKRGRGRISKPKFGKDLTPAPAPQDPAPAKSGNNGRGNNGNRGNGNAPSQFFTTNFSIPTVAVFFEIMIKY